MTKKELSRILRRVPRDAAIKVAINDSSADVECGLRVDQDGNWEVVIIPMNTKNSSENS